MLETVIQEQTAAIKDLTAAIREFMAAKNTGENTSPNAAPKTEEEKVKAPVEPPKPKVAKAKPKEEKTELDLMNEVIEEEEGLPAGERDDAYYKTHVQPHCLQLVAKNKAALVEIVNGHFKAKSAKDIPADKWDELVKLVKAELV